MNDLVNRMYTYVPCGKCFECQESKKDEWMLRSVNEYRNWKGSTLFLTFTYNEECCPWFVQNGRKLFRCFRHSDKDRFLNNLRKFFERLGFGGGQIRYIFTSEYGSRFTHRPHYHSLLFLSYGIMDYIYKNVSRNPYDIVTWLANKFWKQGFMSLSKKYGLFVDNDNAAKYVSKYCCKDLDFFNVPSISRYLGDKFDPLYPERLKAIRDVSPKHFQSKYFGIKLLDELLVSCSHEDDLIDSINRGYPLRKKDNTFKYYPYPQYITRKLTHYQRYDNTFGYTDFGKTLEFKKLVKKIEDYEHTCIEICRLDPCLFSSDCERIFGISASRLFQEVRTYIADPNNLHYAAIYRYVFFRNYVKSDYLRTYVELSSNLFRTEWNIKCVAYFYSQLLSNVTRIARKDDNLRVVDLIDVKDNYINIDSLSRSKKVVQFCERMLVLNNLLSKWRNDKNQQRAFENERMIKYQLKLQNYVD